MELIKMKWFDTVIHKIYSFTTQEFQRYSLIFLGIFCSVALLFGFFHIRMTRKLTQQFKLINKQCVEVGELVERYELVQKQQAEVANILNADKNFKIAGYFNGLLQQLNITEKKTRDPETSFEELENGYQEIKLYAALNQLTIKQLVDLLDALEQKNRIYLKDLEMYKPEQEKYININLTIATLEPKSETVEA